MKTKVKRQRFVLMLMFIFWGMFPTAYQMAMLQRGKFAIGGEYYLLILPFVIAELVFTLADLKKDRKGWCIR
ncbi:MAG: hypothetical protein IKY90_00270 [Oscillospiraceae bacterium]|nr:hypothetical protein [Oscillospiraceae bacterium]